MKAIQRNFPLEYSEEDMYNAVMETMELTTISTTLMYKCIIYNVLKEKFSFTNEQLNKLNEDVNAPDSDKFIASKHEESEDTPIAELLMDYMEKEFGIIEYKKED